MTAALTLTALLCLFGLPLYGRFYISAKIQHPETAKTLPYLCLPPSFMLFSLILHWEQAKAADAFLRLRRYTMQKNRHSKSVERIAVQIA